MAQKITTPKFKLVHSGLIAITNLYPSRDYQASRKGASSNLDVIGATVKVDGEKRKVTIKQEAIDLVNSLLENGWARPDIFVTVKLTAQKKDAAKLRLQWAADVEELKTIELFSGLEGTYSFKGQDVKITHDDMVAEWLRTFPEKVEVKVGRKMTKVSRFDSKDFEAVLAGNRALTLAVVIHNTVARKSDKLDAIITHIERQLRDYGTADNRDKASVFLNEEAKLGKLAPSKLQRLGAAIHMVEKGSTEAGLRTIFAAGKKQRGDIQVHFKVPANMRFLTYMQPKTDKIAAQTVKVDGKDLSGVEAYKVVNDWLMNGESFKPTAQGKNLDSLNAIYNIITHAQGLTEKFKQKGGYGDPKRPAYGVIKGQTLNAVETKERIRANPELTQMVVDYFSNRRNSDWADPRWEGAAAPKHSMANSEITTAAATIEKGLVQDLVMTLAGEDTGHDLVPLLKKVAELVPACFLVDPDTGENVSDYLTPDDMLDVSAKMNPKSKTLKAALKAAG